MSLPLVVLMVLLQIVNALRRPEFVQVHIDNNPVDIYTGPITCRNQTFSREHIRRTVAWARLLRGEEQLTIEGEWLSQFPRHKNKYPHEYGDSDDLDFPQQCKHQTINAWEHPLIDEDWISPTDNNAQYQGLFEVGIRNTNQHPGPTRVVFFNTRNQRTHDGTPYTFFCGLMNHPEGRPGSFELCGVDRLILSTHLVESTSVTTNSSAMEPLSTAS